MQQIIDCSSAYGNFGCDGGWYDASLSYVKEKGLTTYSAYPFAENTNGCKINFGMYKISSYKGGYINGCSALAAMLVTNPVSVGMAAGTQYFMNYKSGIFNKCGNLIDHGVVLVGVYQNDQTG